MAYLVAALLVGVALTGPVTARFPMVAAVYPSSSYLGLWLVGTAGWGFDGIPGPGLAGDYQALVGRLMEIAAVAIFAMQILPRVRSIESFRKR